MTLDCLILVCRDVKFSDLSADELARQLTVDHMTLFRDVRLLRLTSDVNDIEWPNIDAGVDDALARAADAWRHLFSWAIVFPFDFSFHFIVRDFSVDNRFLK
jgi:hypothetical protein